MSRKEFMATLTAIIETPSSYNGQQMKVAKAWNNEKRKRNYEALKPVIEEQHEISKTPGTCQCCERYGRLCLQEDSLMIAEARQRYHSIGSYLPKIQF